MMEHGLTMAKYTFHLIGNAHLDPVWLWDWREGLNEGLITCRTMLDLMDRDPDLTFIRGEASIYQHIERIDPETFARIQQRVAEGRWDVVGGTMIQPDTNLPATETFARHFARGQTYFTSRFGKPVRAAWAADSFGHAAGLPEIMSHAGIDFFAFTRPDPKTLPIAKPAFWWEAPSGARVLSYRPPAGWYGSDDDEMPRRLDALLAEADKTDLHNVGVFYGVGNHGGGPTQRQIADIWTWAKSHPDIRIVHSGLHRFFDALVEESRSKTKSYFPTHRGELNFTLRGCYASVAKFKFAYRAAEALLQRAETIDSTISAALDRKPADLRSAWDGLLFNSFHDVLPGTSIERAMNEQIDWLGGVKHACRAVELDALGALAQRVDTRVRNRKEGAPTGVSVLVFNPHPFAYDGPVEIEAALDYRPIMRYAQGKADQLPLELLDQRGKLMPFQSVATEHSFSLHTAWRKRVVTPMRIPALGWSMLEFAWVEGARPIPQIANPVRAKKNAIENDRFRVEAKAGAKSIKVVHDCKPVFGASGLSVALFDDPAGSWGGAVDSPEAQKKAKPRDVWKIDAVQLLETGPHRGTLWVRFAGKQSWLALTLTLCAGRDAVDVSARLLLNERSARIKLIMPGAADATFDVPGAAVTRSNAGELPGGRWVKTPAFSFASDSLYAFDCTNGALRATVARASRYAESENAGPDEKPWMPAVDAGELLFKFLIAPADAPIEQLARVLERPMTFLLAPPSDGKLPRQGSLASLTPDTLELLALKPADDGDGFIVRVRSLATRPVKGTLRWQGASLPLGSMKPGAIASYRLRRDGSKWNVTPTSGLER